MIDEIPSAVWAKLDLILEKVNKTDLSVSRIEGDGRLQNQVLQHVADALKDFKAEFKEEITEIKAEAEKLKARMEVIEKWQVRLAALGSAVVALFVFFGDTIKQVLGIHHG